MLSSFFTSPVVGMFIAPSAVCAARSAVAFTSMPALTAFCSAPMNLSLERSCEAILLIRSSPVAIIFLNIGFSRSMDGPHFYEGM